ncbi:MAG: hypothetical protein BWX96_03300 [Bacteroidetes bacterium ADurb.Bin145]|nr:MAG: hypothetical protein BWX96_03300 [Bacteroidetes bacterium ADurb.Bin145]
MRSNNSSSLLPRIILNPLYLSDASSHVTENDLTSTGYLVTLISSSNFFNLISSPSATISTSPDLRFFTYPLMPVLNVAFRTYSRYPTDWTSPPAMILTLFILSY